MNGEAVLGNLSDGWTVKASYEKDGRLRPTYHHRTKSVRTAEDPRFEGLAYAIRVGDIGVAKDAG